MGTRSTVTLVLSRRLQVATLPLIRAHSKVGAHGPLLSTQCLLITFLVPPRGLDLEEGSDLMVGRGKMKQQKQAIGSPPSTGKVLFFHYTAQHSLFLVLTFCLRCRAGGCVSPGNYFSVRICFHSHLRRKVCDGRRVRQVPRGAGHPRVYRELVADRSRTGTSQGRQGLQPP